VVHELVKQVKFLDVLDSVACYCKCDPLKSGVINTSAVVTLLKQRINDSANFSREGPKIKLAKNWWFVNFIIIIKLKSDWWLFGHWEHSTK